MPDPGTPPAAQWPEFCKDTTCPSDPGTPPAADLPALRAEHLPATDEDWADDTWCMKCRVDWPCDAIRAADDLEATRRRAEEAERQLAATTTALERMSAALGKLAPAGTAPRTALERLWDDPSDEAAVAFLRAALEPSWPDHAVLAGLAPAPPEPPCPDCGGTGVVPNYFAGSEWFDQPCTECRPVASPTPPPAR